MWGPYADAMRRLLSELGFNTRADVVEFATSAAALCLFVASLAVIAALGG
jgi:hypothetical protein